MDYLIVRMKRLFNHWVIVFRRPNADQKLESRPVVIILSPQLAWYFSLSYVLSSYVMLGYSGRRPTVKSNYRANTSLEFVCRMWLELWIAIRAEPRSRSVDE